jgi:hypothetical protein
MLFVVKTSSTAGRLFVYFFLGNCKGFCLLDTDENIFYTLAQLGSWKDKRQIERHPCEGSSCPALTSYPKKKEVVLMDFSISSRLVAPLRVQL